MLRSLVVASIAVVLGACDEIVSESYATADEARDAGLFSRGWFPDVLPASATEIREVHDLDTNQYCGRATIESEARETVREGLDSLGFVESAAAELPPLECPFSTSDIEGLETLRDAAGHMYIALGRGVVYTWSRTGSALTP